MRPFLVYLFVFVATTCPFISYAEDRGLIWRFEKDGHYSYLMGSVHFADDSFYPLNDAIMTSFEEARVLIVEVDDSLLSTQEQQALMLKYGTYQDGKTIFDHLSSGAISEIRRQFNHFKIPLAQLSSYRPGLLAMTLTMLQAKELGYSAEQGLDRYFLQKARYKKEIRQIEDFEFQMSLLSELPEDEKFIRSSFENMQEYKTHWDGTLSAWKEGDADKLYELAIGEPMQEYPELTNFYDVLFFDRHDDMTKTAEACIAKKEVCFIVVGAGHLVGKQGVVAELQRRGYQLKQF